MHTHTWHVTINLSEQDAHTHAEAVLHTDVGPDRHHEGVARRNPHDRDVAEIGDELAVARALSGLAQDLLDATNADIADNSAPVRTAAEWKGDRERPGEQGAQTP